MARASCWCDARHRTKRALRQNFVILALRQLNRSSRKPRNGVSGRLSEGLAGPGRNPRVRGKGHSYQKKEQSLGRRKQDLVLPIAPWLSSKYSPSPYSTLEWDPWPETGLQHPHKILPQSWVASHSAPFASLANHTCPDQSHRSADISVLISSTPLYVSFSQQGLGLTPSALLSQPLGCYPGLTPTTYSSPLPS